MGDVIRFPNNEVSTVKEALESALEEADVLEKGIVVATDSNGEMFISASGLTAAEAVFILERAKKFLLEY